MTDTLTQEQIDALKLKCENAIENEEVKQAIWPPSEQDTSGCLLYTSPSPRDKRQSRMPSSA